MKLASILFFIGFVATASAATTEEIMQLRNVFLDALNSIWVNVLAGPLQGAIQTVAELGAQLTAGIAVGGIDAILGLIGGRAFQKGLFDFLGDLFGTIADVSVDIFNTAIQPALVAAGQQGALLAAQLTASLIDGGLPALQGLLSGIGKRELTVFQKGLFDFLGDLFGSIADISVDIFNTAIQPALIAAGQQGALLAAQLTASLIDGGLPALQGLLGGIGKRELTVFQKGLFDFLGDLFGTIADVSVDIFNTAIQPALVAAGQQGALLAAQLTASLIDGGLPALQGLLSGIGK